MTQNYVQNNRISGSFCPTSWPKQVTRNVLETFVEVMAKQVEHVRLRGIGLGTICCTRL